MNGKNWCEIALDIPYYNTHSFQKLYCKVILVELPWRPNEGLRQPFSLFLVTPQAREGDF